MVKGENVERNLYIHNSLQDHSLLFQNLSGHTSSLGRQSTLTLSSPDFFPPLLMTKSPPPSVILTSQLAVANHPSASNPMETGPLLGMPLHLPSSVSSPITPKNYNNTLNTYFSFSEPFCIPTPRSLTLTKPSASTQEKSNILNCPNLVVSDTLRLITSKMMVPETGAPPLKRKRSLDLITGPMKPVINGIAESVIGKPLNGGTDTCALTAMENTHEWDVRRKMETSEQYMLPKFVHDLIWGVIDDDISPSARYSLFADPLPRPPQSELENVIANETISRNPELFKITCNIN
jgi:hypothetical protein